MSHRNGNGEAPGRLVVFSSELGWFALVHHRYTILRTTVGHRSRHDALAAMTDYAPLAVAPNVRETRWMQRIRRYACGHRVSLTLMQIDQSWMSPFQRRVVDACRAIGYGETLTYGQLARLAGSPGASRAVGSVMSKNRFPLIVPCHRVVSCNGIGGFSAPTGLELKRQLLAGEGVLIA